MNKIITTIFENGLLCPLTSLGLPEHISMSFPPQPKAAEVEHERVRAVLVAAGLALLQPEPLRPEQLADVERMALARRIPAGPPLSELIIAEREGH